MMVSIFKRLLSLVMLLSFALLTACGGGGGATGSQPVVKDDGNSASSTVGTILLTMTSTLAGSTKVNSLSAGTSAYLNATVTDPQGAPVSGAVVTFTVPSELAVLTPALGTALTDAKGMASIQVDAAGAMKAGAGAASAAASWGAGNKSYTAASVPLGFAVGSASVTLGSMTISPATISAYGSASISIPVLINGSPATVPISVAFTSGCVGTNKATLTTPVTTVNGVATTTYKDIASCASTDTVTASVTGTAAIAAGTVKVNAPVANNIAFSSASPTVIGIAGTGLPTSSVVKFKVVDANNNGVSGKSVNFSLTPALAAGSVALSANSGSSDGNGEVSVSVTSGTAPTPVWVVATLADDANIKSQSTALTVTTGLPTQNFFSLSISTHNIEGWSIDGTQTALTVIASDRLGNPVPDNTAINFVTEGGQIQGGTNGQATCATVAGTCTLNMKSANFRPSNGRVSILAYALGEKSFVDTNANNTWDAGETYYDLGDPFIDNNENGAWDSGEQSWSYAAGSQTCGAHVNGAAAATALPTNYADASSKDNTCNASMTGTGIRAYVRRQAVVTFSGSTATFAQGSSNVMGLNCRATFSFRMMDVNGNPMPRGTKIESGNNNVTFISNTTGKPVNATVTINGDTVPDSTAVGGTWHSFTVDGGNTDCPGNAPNAYPAGTFDLVAKTPAGVESRQSITIQ